MRSERLRAEQELADATPASPLTAPRIKATVLALANIERRLGDADPLPRAQVHGDLRTEIGCHPTAPKIAL